MLKQHCCYCGITNSGKTTAAGVLFSNTSGINIFINTNAEPHIEERGENFTNMDDLIKAMNENERKLIFTPDYIKDEDFEKLQAVLFALGKSLAGSDRKVWCHVYFDEVQELAGKMARQEVIERFWTRGKRHGIIAVGITQRPALVSQTILTQSFYHVIFELGIYETPYFEKYHIPYEDKIREWVGQKYHYVIFSPTGEIVYKEPVKI